MDGGFESFANSKRYKTTIYARMIMLCLRALLIQKDTKLSVPCKSSFSSLRALLIQKDTKLCIRASFFFVV